MAIIDKQQITEAFETLMGQLASKENDLLTREAEIVKLEDQIRGRDQDSRKKQADLTKRETLVESYEMKVQKDKDLYKWENELKDKEESLSALSNELSTKEINLAGTEAQSKAEAKRLLEWSQRLADKEANYKTELEAKVLQQMKDNLFSS